MTRRDWTLAVLAAANGQPLSPVQLQKCVFLVSRNLPVGDEFYHFVPYNYGPFSNAVYSDCEEMALEGFVSIEKAPSGFTIYSATDAGISRASQLRGEIGQRAGEYIDKVVAWAQKLSFSQIVRAIYDAYPEYRANSVFRF